jgi:hypothetical protein
MAQVFPSNVLTCSHASCDKVICKEVQRRKGQRSDKATQLGMRWGGDTALEEL